MRKRATNLLPVSAANEHPSRPSTSYNPAPVKGNLQNKRANSKRLKALGASLAFLGLYFVCGWISQFIDYTYDNQRLRDKQRQAAETKQKFPLFYDIPLIPSSNWPVFSRWFRPHNAHIVHNAKHAIEEFGEDLRKLTQRGKHPLTYDSHIQSKDDPELREWFHERAVWLKGNAHSGDFPLNALPRPNDRKALVICAGDRQLHYLKTLVHTVRHIHRSYVGIRVVYRDENDLSEKGMQEIQQVSDVNLQFINLSQYFDLDSVQLKGWNLKAFGVLAVAETEVAVMDADVMLLQSPDRLFQQETYQRTGALFYHDRVKPQFYWDVGVFAKWLQPDLSHRALKILTYGHTVSTSFNSEQIQEAGLILLDKKRRMLGIWAACLLFGRPDIRKYAQMDHMYGDKEVYWTAFETIKEDYEFARFYPGVLGGTVTDFRSLTTHLSLDAEASHVESTWFDAVELNQALCGRLLHFDDDGKPLWTNGGYMLKEDDWSSSADISQSAVNPVWYMDGGDSTKEEFPNPWLPFLRNLLQFYWTMKGENQVWALQRSMGVECLSPNTRSIRRLSDELVGTAKQAVRYYFETKQKEKGA